MRAPTIAIRKETKDRTQQRAPLAPAHVAALVAEHGIKTLVEPWEQRVFADEEYAQAGATLTENLEPAKAIFGVKEVAPEFLLPGRAFAFFSHVVKAQPYNMPMLCAILEREITLIDYELIADDAGRRTVFFGDYAGYAGMIDSLWAFGQRLDRLGVRHPFSSVRYATHYRRLSEARADVRVAGASIAAHGLDPSLVPLICGFTGYGNVSRAAQSVFEELPVIDLDPEELPAFMGRGSFSATSVYRVVFSKPHLYRSMDGSTFALETFNRDPGSFTSRLHEFLPHLSMLINGIYWEPRFPRIVSRQMLLDVGERRRLKVIGDITCDIDGSIEATVKETNAENPIYVYDPRTGTIQDGAEGEGVVVLAVDKLPTELPWEASQSFGSALLPMVPEIARMDISRPYETLNLSPSLLRAVITHRGKLTPPFAYLEPHLQAEATAGLRGPAGRKS